MDKFFALTTDDKRAALDDAWDVALATETALYAQRRLNEKSARTPTLLSGNVIQSSSSNGHAATAFTPGAGAPTPIEFARLWRELMTMFERAAIWYTQPVGLDGYVPTTFSYRARDTFALVTVNLPVAAPTDAQVDGLLRTWLVPVTEAQSDYNALRLGNGLAYVG